MKKNRMLAVACGAFIVALSAAHAQTTQAPSPGADQSYSNSQGKYDPYSQGMNQGSTKSNLSPSTAPGSPMDPSAPPQGASPQAPYPGTMKPDPQFDTGGHVYDRRNPYFQGG
jgi:hypothetical protein